MTSMTHSQHRMHFAVRTALMVFASLFVAGLAATRAIGSDAGVTDYSAADPGGIEMVDITEALAVPRGTRIEPTAPPTVRLPIFFEFNSTKLKPEAEQLLDKVGAALASDDLAEFRFSVEGHTDSVGSNGYNSSLSEQRAAAVKSYLLARGVPESRLGTVGHGEGQPVADNQSDEGRQRNRRVELINLGSSTQ